MVLSSWFILLQFCGCCCMCVLGSLLRQVRNALEPTPRNLRPPRCVDGQPPQQHRRGFTSGRSGLISGGWGPDGSSPRRHAPLLFAPTQFHDSAVCCCRPGQCKERLHAEVAAQERHPGLSLQEHFLLAPAPSLIILRCYDFLSDGDRFWGVVINTKNRFLCNYKLWFVTSFTPLCVSETSVPPPFLYACTLGTLI